MDKYFELFLLLTNNKKASTDCISYIFTDCELDYMPGKTYQLKPDYNYELQIDVYFRGVIILNACANGQPFRASEPFNVKSVRVTTVSDWVSSFNWDSTFHRFKNNR